MQQQVALTQIVDNPFQARQVFDSASVRSLADEIKAGGFWNTTLQARRSGNGKLELVFGHRRLRALRLLKIPKVTVEIVDLTDAEMALRGLEENLQREGLSDLEKADGVRKAVEIATAERKAAGKPERGAVQEVADRLGLAQPWVSSLLSISISMDMKERDQIQAGYITAKTALAAKQCGGDDYLRTLAKQGKNHKKGDSPVKPTHMTVAAMRKAVAQAPEPVRKKLKQEIVEGKVVTPEQAEKRARSLASAHVRREKEPPPDLRVVIVGWTRKLKEWEKEMATAAPYMDYVESVPAIADDFRAALKKLIETAKGLL